MKALITALLLCIGGSAASQVNQVRNPDFEQYTICPNNYDEITFATYWSGVDSLGRISCVPDYCNICAHINSPVTVPNGDKYYQNPRSGKGFAEVGFFCDDSTEQRDYLQGRLVNTLTPGKSYCVSFYINLGEGSKYAIKEISAYLDNGLIDTTRTCERPQTQYVPQVTNSAGIITDTASWVKIEGSFVANGSERFITIGNFRSNSQTTHVMMPYNGRNAGIILAIYLVEDVSVIESDLPADAGPDKHVGKGDSVYIGRLKEVGLECTWSVLGSTAVIGTGAGIWVKPTATTSYVVTQTLCGAITKDMVRVEVWAAGLHSIKGQAQQYTLSPNPSDGHITLSQPVADDLPVRLEILTVTSKRVFSQSVTFKEGKASVNMPLIAAGMYYLHLQDATGNAYTLKFVKQ